MCNCCEDKEADLLKKHSKLIMSQDRDIEISFKLFQRKLWVLLILVLLPNLYNCMAQYKQHKRRTAVVSVISVKTGTPQQWACVLFLL